EGPVSHARKWFQGSMRSCCLGGQDRAAPSLRETSRHAFQQIARTAAKESGSHAGGALARRRTPRRPRPAGRCGVAVSRENAWIARLLW
ncbi:MAG TPA: hypothetical protein PKC18_19905, partial [Lacipirellulaceae bacterium]|nr:hypothetical protein [Lacipirellulaceae bacterium]